MCFDVALMKKCKNCPRVMDLLEEHNKKARELAESKGLAFHRFEHVPHGEEFQCACGAWIVVGG